MTITLHWWAVPLGIVLLGLIVGFAIDSDLREGNNGLMEGCLGVSIIGLAAFLAIGVTIGHFL
jgi:hypothetical protein